jgi:hypothetical protein
MLARRILPLLIALLPVTVALADDGSGPPKSDLGLPNALVNPKPTGASCAQLQQQLDDAIATHADAPRLPSAQAYSISGQRKCSGGDYTGGVKDLTKGLKALKLQPRMS